MVTDRQKVRTDDAKTISLRLRRGIIKLKTGAKEIQQVNPGGPDNSQSIRPLHLINR